MSVLAPRFPWFCAAPWSSSDSWSLPVLWWLLRMIPPQPRRIDFPPTRVVVPDQTKQETRGARLGWLNLLRLTLATLVILAAAGPLWNSAA